MQSIECPAVPRTATKRGASVSRPGQIHVPETSSFVVARPRTQPLAPTSPRGKSGAVSVCTRRRCSQPQLLSGSSRGWCEAPCADGTAASASASPSGRRPRARPDHRPRWHGFEKGTGGQSQIQTNCDDSPLALEIGTPLFLHQEEIGNEKDDCPPILIRPPDAGADTSANMPQGAGEHDY